MLRFVFCACLLFGFAREGNAQEPDWFRKSPRSTPVVDFARGVGSGPTQALARRRSRIDALVEEEFEGSLEVTSVTVQKLIEELRKSIRSGQEGVTIDRFMQNIQVNGGESTYVPGLQEVVTAFQQTSVGEYRVWTLFAVPKPGVSQDSVYQELKRLRSEQRRAIRRRSIVPGLGQFYKGSYRKGKLILAGEVILAGTLVYSILRQNQLTEMISNSRSRTAIDAYQNRRSDWHRIAIASGFAAGAVYLFSLFDSLFSPSDDFPLLAVSLRSGREASTKIHLTWNF